jgi:polysaccharide export outer membrane protein
MRLADLIANAGGLSPMRDEGGQVLPSPADLASARLLRDGRVLPINFERALVGDAGHNVYVRRGDVVYIPFVESNGVAILGQVGGPGVIPYRFGLRLTHALALSGGLAPWGDGDDVRIVRGPPVSPTVYRASLDEIVEGETGDVSLVPGDVVFVQDEPLEDFSEILMVISPFVAVLSTVLLTTLVLSEPE